MAAIDLSLAVVIFVVWVIPLAALAVLDRLAWRRVYDYARNEADRRDVTDPKGQAYSDMATVIVLRGKIGPRVTDDPRDGLPLKRTW